MNRDNVINFVCEIGGFNSDELSEYESLISLIINSITSKVKKETYLSDSRLEYYAGVKIYFFILASGASIVDNTTVFKAGEVSISKSAKSIESAKALLNSAYCDCADLIKDVNFAFFSV